MGLFRTGRIVLTSGIRYEERTDGAFECFVRTSLRRHQKGDWGALCDSECERNDKAIKNEHLGLQTEQLFSCYEYNDLLKIYIVTEIDRSVTTVLLPEEY